MNGEYIVKYVKVQKVTWFSHIQRKEQDALIKKILKWRPTASRSRKLPKKDGNKKFTKT